MFKCRDTKGNINVFHCEVYYRRTMNKLSKCSSTWSTIARQEKMLITLKPTAVRTWAILANLRGLTRKISVSYCPGKKKLWYPIVFRSCYTIEARLVAQQPLVVNCGLITVSTLQQLVTSQLVTSLTFREITKRNKMLVWSNYSLN